MTQQKLESLSEELALPRKIECADVMIPGAEAERRRDAMSSAVGVRVDVSNLCAWRAARSWCSKPWGVCVSPS